MVEYILGSWNGTSMLFESKANQPDEELWSDASGSWGCGALWGGEWFQQSWVNISHQGKPGMDSITPMELLPIVIAAAIWGLKWAGCTVRSNCDNEAVVSVINSGRCEHELMMHLVLRCVKAWEFWPRSCKLLNCSQMPKAYCFAYETW